MNEYIIMSESTEYWGEPRWKVYDVPARGTGSGPVKGSPAASTKEEALKLHRMLCEHNCHDSEQAEPGREYILVLSPNWGPTERWLKAEWF